MGIQLNLPTTIRRHTNGEKDIHVEASRVDEMLEFLCTRFPGLRSAFFPSAGKLNSNVLVFVNDELIQFLQDLQTPLSSQDRVTLVIGASGG